MTDTPALKDVTSITLLGREVAVRMPSDEQLGALLAFEEAIRKIDLLPDGDEKTERKIRQAKRNLLLVENLIISADDWDWMMDSMIRRELSWDLFGDIPELIGVAFAGQGNRSTRRAAARRTRKD